MFTIIGADHKEYGPVSAEDIAQWIKDGRADGRTLAKVEGTQEWKPLANFPEFAVLTAAVGAPPKFTGASIHSASASKINLDSGIGDFEVGDCLSQGWALLMSNFGLLATATFIIWLMAAIAEYIPFAGLFVKGVLFGGLYLVYLKRVRGQETSVGEAFSGFGVGGSQLVLTGFIMSLLTGIACCFVLPGIYLKVAWIFALPLVIDKRLEFWTALELSRKVTTRIWMKVFALATIAFLPYILFQGFVYFQLDTMMYSQMQAIMSGSGLPDLAKLMELAKQIGPVAQKLNLQAQVLYLVNLPFATGALMFAYEALFGSRPTPTA